MKREWRDGWCYSSLALRVSRPYPGCLSPLISSLVFLPSLARPSSVLPSFRWFIRPYKATADRLSRCKIIPLCGPACLDAWSVDRSASPSVCRSVGLTGESGRELIAAFREEEGKSHSPRFPSQLCLPGGLRTGACGADQAYMFRRRQTLAKR